MNKSPRTAAQNSATIYQELSENSPPIPPTAENGTIIIKVNGPYFYAAVNQNLTPAQGTACEVSQKKLDSSFNNMINARRGGNGPLFRPEEKFPFRNFAILRAFALAK